MERSQLGEARKVVLAGVSARVDSLPLRGYTKSAPVIHETDDDGFDL